MTAIHRYPWPGNIRELKSVARRAVVLAAPAGPIGIAHLGESIGRWRRDGGWPPPAVDKEMDAILSAARAAGARRNPGRPASRLASAGAAPRRLCRGRPTREQLRRLLRRHEGNVSRVARALGRERSLVHGWIKRAGLDPARFRLRIRA